MWLVTHNRLMTNKERAKRGLTTNSNCPHCNNTEETVEHILRRCKKTEGVWNHFNFFITAQDPSQDFKTWLLNNMKDQNKGTEFGIICWCLWKQRNEEAMEGKSFSEIGLIKRISACFTINTYAVTNSACIGLVKTSNRERRFISWKPPKEGWIQQQSDGSYKSSNRSAAAGGLLRDHLGKCTAAYACNLGSCTITRAELKGAVEGLKIAWEKGYRKVEVNLDSNTAVSILKEKGDTSSNHGLLALQAKELLSRSWTVNINHVYRECNSAADFLASMGHDLHFGTHHLDTCDPKLLYWLNYDARETSQERDILI
ncbi:unnamed protein product [Linum trigynum]|uniref:RNase H type-1 domain-containing protein n=1 Tax=Linum trigynum TaxID=586398 RepID=A0AAV2E588_9ROSI